MIIKELDMLLIIGIGAVTKARCNAIGRPPIHTKNVAEVSVKKLERAVFECVTADMHQPTLGSRRTLCFNLSWFLRIKVAN
jgi:hypothetical protein